MKINERHENAVILVGDLSPDEKAKVISICNDGVTLGFGSNYTNVSKVSFLDCEAIWSV